jgi:uncharacterized protein involved in type VI secretion and phage assembly
MEIVPQLWFLTKTRDRIFQHVGVVEILQSVFQGLDVSFEILAIHPRDFCVQYCGTDFNAAA